MNTVPPTDAPGGSRLVITGWYVVNTTSPLLGIEFTVTVTGPGPFGVPAGTSATICVSLQLVIDVAATPLKRTTLPPCVVPKFEPLIVTAVPIPPDAGDTLATIGVVPASTATLSNVAVSS